LFIAIAERKFTGRVYHADLSQLLTGITQCQYDAAISSLASPRSARKTCFLRPYLESGQQVAVRIDSVNITDKASLKGRVIGTQNGTAGALEAEAIEE